MRKKPLSTRQGLLYGQDGGRIRAKEGRYGEYSKTEGNFPNYNFNESARHIKLLDEHKNVVVEVDILLVSMEWTMAIEMKCKPDKDDVDNHLKRMKLLRKYSYAAVRGKKLVGAIAGGEVSQEVRDYAQKSGLYVLELNGEQVSLVESPPGFVALES